MAITINPTAAALFGAAGGLLQGSGYRPYPVSTGEALSGGFRGFLQGYGMGQQFLERQQQQDMLRRQQEALQQLPGIVQTPEGEPASLGAIGRGLIGLEDPRFVRTGISALIADQQQQAAIEAARIKAAADRAKAKDFDMTAAHSNTLYKGAASIYGGVFDELGNLRALDPSVHGAVQGLWTTASEIFNANRGKMSHAKALTQAANLLRRQGVNVPEIPGRFQIPTGPAGVAPLPGAAAPAALPGATPTPGGDLLFQQASAAIARGADPQRVAQTFVDQGGDPGLLAQLGLSAPRTEPSVEQELPKTFKDSLKQEIAQERTQERKWFDANVRRLMRPEGKSTGLPFTTHQPMTKDEAAKAIQRLQININHLSAAQRLQANQAIERLSRFLRE